MGNSDKSETEVIRETRVRYLHHEKYKETGSSLKSEEVSIQNNGKITGGHGGHKLTLASKESDTIVMETLENNVAHTLRLLNLNLKRITPNFFNSYGNVQRLEVGCHISVVWMFRYIPYMKSLSKVRFGRQSMCYDINEPDDATASTQKFRPNPSVSLLELSYDVEEYVNMDEEKKQRISSKIKLVLTLAPDSFPTLSECHLTIPKCNEVDLDSFLSRFPSLRASGEKRAKFSMNYIQFISLKTPRKSSASDKDRRRSHDPSSKSNNEIPIKKPRDQSLPSSSRPAKSLSKSSKPQAKVQSQKDKDNNSQSQPIQRSPAYSNSNTDSTIIVNKSHKENDSEPGAGGDQKIIMQDPRKRRSRSDDDIVCLADSPTSSGIPADVDGHGPGPGPGPGQPNATTIPAKVASSVITTVTVSGVGIGSDGGGGGAAGNGQMNSQKSYPNKNSVPSNHPTPKPTHHVPRVDPDPSSSSDSGSSSSDYSPARGNYRRNKNSGRASPSLMDYSRRSTSPEYIRPKRHKN